MSQRIAHIVQKMAPGGLEVIALQLAQQLPGEHVLISLEGEAKALCAAWPRLAGFRAERFFAMNKQPGIDPLLPFRLRALLRRERIEAVVTHHVGPLIYGGLAARLAGLRNIIHVEHDVWHCRDGRRRFIMRLGGWLVAPKVVGVAEALRAPLYELYPGSSVDIIENGVDLARFGDGRAEARRRLGLPPDGIGLDQPAIGAVGRLEWVKGHDVLIEAFARLDPRAILILIGEGSRRQALEEQARQLGLADRIRFLGHRDDIAALLPGFDLFVQPSRQEGLPFAVLEAQACGVPTIASDVGALRQAICPRSGRLTPPEDVAALSAAMADFLARFLAEQPADRGGAARAPSPRAFVAARFDWRNTLNGYAKLLKA